MINLFKHSVTTLIWNVNSIWMEVGLTIEYLMIATLSCRWMEIAYHWVARSDSFLIFCYALCQMPDRRRRSSLRPTANIASHVAAINYGFPRRSTQRTYGRGGIDCRKQKCKPFTVVQKKSFEKSNLSACFYETSLSKVLFQSISNTYPITW